MSELGFEEWQMFQVCIYTTVTNTEFIEFRTHVRQSAAKLPAFKKFFNSVEIEQIIKAAWSMADIILLFTVIGWVCAVRAKATMVVESNQE